MTAILAEIDAVLGESARLDLLLAGMPRYKPDPGGVFSGGCVQLGNVEIRNEGEDVIHLALVGDQSYISGVSPTAWNLEAAAEFPTTPQARALGPRHASTHIQTEPAVHGYRMGFSPEEWRVSEDLITDRFLRKVAAAADDAGWPRPPRGAGPRRIGWRLDGDGTAVECDETDPRAYEIELRIQWIG